MRISYGGALLALFGSLGLSAGLAKPIEHQTWTTLRPLPASVSEVGVGTVGGRIYVIGGTQENVAGPPIPAIATNRVFDPRANKWTEAAPLPAAASHVGVTVLGDKLYAVGGFSDLVHIGPQDGFHVFDPATNRWTALAPLPTKRGSVAAASVGGKIHVFGGRLSDKITTFTLPNGQSLELGLDTVNSHDIYDPATNRWSKGAALPGPARDHMGIAVLGGKIHVFGGRINDFSDLLDRHDVYDPKLDRWTSAAPLPQPRSAGAFTVAKGRIVYAGGECKPGGAPGMKATFDTVAAYDPKTNRWATLTRLPEGRQAFGAATVGNNIYLVGGSPTCGGGGSSDVVAMKL